MWLVGNDVMLRAQSAHHHQHVFRIILKMIEVLLRLALHLRGGKVHNSQSIVRWCGMTKPAQVRWWLHHWVQVQVQRPRALHKTTPPMSMPRTQPLLPVFAYTRPSIAQILNILSEQWLLWKFDRHRPTFSASYSNDHTAKHLQTSD